jgi:hypothetical protein
MPFYGRGFGYGRGLGLRCGWRAGYGRGYGVRYGWYPPSFGPGYPEDPAEEVDLLKTEADYLKKSIEAINRRISELEKESAQEA